MLVRPFHALEAVAPLRAELDALNRASRRPSPFCTLEFFQNYLAHDEFYPGGEGLTVWFLVAYESGRPVGYLPLRLVHEQVAGVATPKLEFLATHDVERPHLVARPEDERRCAQAFYAHLLERKSEWSMLELKQLEPGSPLFPLPNGLDLHAHYVRPFECMPVHVIPNHYTDVLGYLEAMNKKFRTNTRRQMRNLLSAGTVTYLSSRDPAALPALLDLYLHVEQRSWKAKVQGTIGRDPRRVEFFRGLAGADQPFRLEVGLLLLDGAPIAGSISGEFERRSYALQVAYDERLARLSPGSVLFAMMMKQAIDRHAECLNLMSGFSYYKTHWLAEEVDCQTAQVFRVGSPLFYRALLGELKRTLQARLLPPPPAENGNTLRHQVEEETGPLPPVPATDARFFEARLSSLRALGVETLTAADLDAAFGLNAKGSRRAS